MKKKQNNNPTISCPYSCKAIEKLIEVMEMYAMSDKDITDDKEWLTWLKCIYSVLSSEERLKLLSA